MSKVTFIVHLIILFSFELCKAQSNAKLYAQIDANSSSLHLKWYLPKFVSEEPVFVWRQLPDSSWQKIRSTAFSFDPVVNKSQLTAKEKEAFSLLQSKQQLTGVAMLQVLMQSFYSQNLSNTAAFGCTIPLENNSENTVYKITRASTGQVIFQNKAIASTQLQKTVISSSLTLQQKKSKIELSYTSPSQHVWAVLIFRTNKDSSKAMPITSLPQLITTDTSNRNSRVFIDKSAQENNSYTYQLKGITHFGDTVFISRAEQITMRDYTLPEPATELRYLVSKRKVALSWKKTNSGDCKYYSILRTQKNDTDFVLVGRTANATSYSFIDSINTFQSYHYKIRTIDTSGNFSDSYPLLVEAPDQEPPERPEIISVLGDSSSIIIEWKIANCKDYAGCYIFRSINDSARTYFVRITPEPVKLNSFRDQLPTNTKNRYFYKLVAVDSSLNYSAYSNIASCRLPDKTAPSPVFLQTLQQHKNQIKLIWFKNPESDLKNYLILVYDSTEHTWHAPINAHRDSTQLLESKLPYNHLYRIQVYACDSSNNKSKDGNSQLIFLRPVAIEGNASEKLKIRIQSNKDSLAFSIHWRTLSEDSIKGYTIYRKSQIDETFLPRSGFISGSQQFTDTEVSKNTSYTYQVRALQTDGDILLSNQITVSTYENKKQKVRNKKH